MIDLLHAFAIGIAFSVGVCAGAVLCQLATRESRKSMSEDWKKSQATVEKRLTDSLNCHLRMAEVMEAWAAKEGMTKLKQNASSGSSTKG